MCIAEWVLLHLSCLALEARCKPMRRRLAMAGSSPLLSDQLADLQRLTMLVDLQTAQRMRGEAAATHTQAPLPLHLGLAGWRLACVSLVVDSRVCDLPVLLLAVLAAIVCVPQRHSLLPTLSSSGWVSRRRSLSMGFQASACG